MRLLGVSAENFASYKSLEFEFNSGGLLLISGPTGAGKSTLQDVVPWCLFGVTAKDGAADDVRPWGGDGSPTTAKVELEVNGVVITVCRIRGTQKQNDLYWLEQEAVHIRGKDINETQELLNSRIGFDAYSYISSCYYNESNPASLFFGRAKAHERRELFESVVDLSFPTNLTSKINDDRKTTKDTLKSLTSKLDKAIGKGETLVASYTSTHKASLKWEADHKRELVDLETKNSNFESSKKEQIAQLIDLRQKFEERRNSQLENTQTLYEETKDRLRVLGDATCDKCLQPNKTVIDTQKALERLHFQFEDFTKAVNPHVDKIEMAKARENPYEIQLTYAREQRNKNLYVIQLKELREAIDDNDLLVKHLTLKAGEEDRRLGCLTTLQELGAQMRTHLLHSTIKSIENHTNKFLDKYFDAEIRVGFSVGEKDNLDVVIRKSGYECSYKQLSKGQKGLLKLCFSVAIMRASSDKSGVSYSTLFFDESLDGFDAALKIKAYALFESLLREHETILVIDHSTELSGMFSNKYIVYIQGDCSTINII